jgi:hypothetical protein
MCEKAGSHGFRNSDLKKEQRNTHTAINNRKTKETFKKVKDFGSINTLRFLPDQGGDVCEVWFRLVQKCEFV